jgi:hypothetical protein
MFEKASRVKLRFSTTQGVLATEDLWDLKLTALDVLARALHKSLEESEISFITPATAANETAKLKFDIVKHVIDSKLAAQEAARTQAEKATQKARILEILAKKQDASLEAKTTEELLKDLEALG